LLYSSIVLTANEFFGHCVEKLLDHLSISWDSKVTNGLILTLTVFRIERIRYVPSNYAWVSCA